MADISKINPNGTEYNLKDEVARTTKAEAIEITITQYEALSTAEKNDPTKIYFITDYPSGSGVVINPTGTATDTAETIEVDGTIYDFMDADAVHTADIGVAGGVAELDSNGKVPSSQLPSYVDDVVEYASISAFPATGESGKIYVALDTNKTYRWTGSVYVEISPSLALGETSSTAYRGDRGKTAYDHSQSDHSGIAPAFTEASTRANIASGETFATLLGKIKKFFSDLKAVAFSGSYNDLSDTPTIPAAQIQSDWNQTDSAQVDFIKNKPTISDTKVTSSANHYTPSTASGSDKTASASGATAAWSIDVVQGVTLNTDGKGHVTGLSVTSGKIPANPNTNTIPSAYCSTAAGTAAKTASCTGYALLSKSYLHVIITTTNTAQSALTLNVNGKGAKPIYINGSASSASNYSLTAGSYLVYYNGTNYYFRTDGKLTADITGSAASATKATQDGDGNTISSTYLKKSGGTMTGTLTSRSIEPSSDTLYALGSSSKRFNVGWFRALDSDTVTCGRTGTDGTSTQGILEFYPYNHANDNRVQFMVDSSATLTTIYTVSIRAKSGTLALTSDIPSVPSQAETTRRSRYTMSTKGAWTTVSYSSNLPSSYGHAIILIYYTISGIRCLMNEIRVTKAEWEDCANPNIMMPFVSSPPNDAYGVYLQYVSTSQFKYYVGSGLAGDWSVVIKTTVV